MDYQAFISLGVYVSSCCSLCCDYCFFNLHVIPCNSPDSPDLSLLIRNKGSEPVTVTIIAPEYVQLEETKVLLQQKEDKKVNLHMKIAFGSWSKELVMM